MNSSNPAHFVFIVFADDWGRHPSSCQHIFRRILPKTEVLWVNTVGLRTPRFSLYDLRRSIEILTHWFLPKSFSGQTKTQAISSSQIPVELSPKVIRPIMLPFFHWRWAERINQVLIQRSIQVGLKELSPHKQRILVTTLPIIPGLFRNQDWARKIYYCVDDFTTWQGVSGDTMKHMEERLLPYCDVLIATSTGLLETRGRSIPNSHLLTHGVDWNHFRKAMLAPPHPTLQILPKPILGMFGSFDARIDGGILGNLAQRFNAGSLVILGPVDRDITEFLAYKNIHFLGAIPYKDLPGYVSALDILVLPYIIDASTDKINPLKLKEYLATGKPVVTTPLPEALRLSKHLTVIDRDGFVEAVAQLLKGQASTSAKIAPALQAFLESESWEGKAEQFCNWALEGLA